MNQLSTIYTPTALIFTFFPITDITSTLRLVSKRWNEVSESNQLWFALISRDFPHFVMTGGKFEKIFEQVFFSASASSSTSPSLWFCPGRAFYAFANLSRHEIFAVASSLIYFNLAVIGIGQEEEKDGDDKNRSENSPIPQQLTLNSLELAEMVNSSCQNRAPLFFLHRLLHDCVKEISIVANKITTRSQPQVADLEDANSFRKRQFLSLSSSSSSSSQHQNTTVHQEDQRSVACQLMNDYFLQDTHPQYFSSKLREISQSSSDNLKEEDESSMFEMIKDYDDDKKYDNHHFETLAEDIHKIWFQILVPVENNLISSFYYLSAGMNVLDLVQLLISPLFLINFSCAWIFSTLYPTATHEQQSFPNNNYNNDTLNSSTTTTAINDNDHNTTTISLFLSLLKRFMFWHGQSFCVAPLRALVPTKSFFGSLSIFLLFSVPIALLGFGFIGEFLVAALGLRTSLEEKSVHLHFEKFGISKSLTWGSGSGECSDEKQTTTQENHHNHRLQFLINNHLKNLVSYSLKMSLYRSACMTVVAAMFQRPVIQPLEETQILEAVMKTVVTSVLIFSSSLSLLPSRTEFVLKWASILLFAFGYFDSIFSFGCRLMKMMDFVSFYNNHDDDHNSSHQQQLYSCSSLVYSSGLMGVMSFVLLSTNFMTCCVSSSSRVPINNEAENLRSLLLGLDGRIAAMSPRVSLFSSRNKKEKHNNFCRITNSSSSSSSSSSKEAPNTIKSKMKNSSFLSQSIRSFICDYFVRTEFLHFVRWAAVDFVSSQILLGLGGSFVDVLAFNFVQCLLVGIVSQIAVPYFLV